MAHNKYINPTPQYHVKCIKPHNLVAPYTRICQNTTIYQNYTTIIPRGHPDATQNLFPPPPGQNLILGRAVSNSSPSLPTTAPLEAPFRVLLSLRKHRILPLRDEKQNNTPPHVFVSSACRIRELRPSLLARRALPATLSAIPSLSSDEHLRQTLQLLRLPAHASIQLQQPPLFARTPYESIHPLHPLPRLSLRPPPLHYPVVFPSPLGGSRVD